MFANEDTIAAIASPPGAAIRGIVRISGPQTTRILQTICPSCDSIPTRASRIRTPIELGPPLGQVDASILLWPNERCYTGMPSAEIHLPGAAPILNAALERLLDHGARMAEPGEFTMRAFLAGRLDLTEAEAVLGVIDADDKRTLDTALRQLSGGLSGPLNQLRTELLNLLAHLEAGLDFVEEDIEFITQAELSSNIQRICHQIEAITEQMTSREAATGPPQVVLRGDPNAGKSSLINALSGQEIAIVSELAGTTRDCVERTIDCGGLAVRVIDTAGIEATDDAINQQAQRLGDRAHEEADLLLVCVDLTQTSLLPWQQTLRTAGADSGNRAAGRPMLFVGTKRDRCQTLPDWVDDDWVLTSSLTDQGIANLKSRIGDRLQTSDVAESSTISSTAVRCRETLAQATDALANAHQVIRDQLGEELVAAELRFALDAIGRVTGVVYTDDILDRIFSEFCIGK
ncbi:tRNA modification GTPase MnmE [Rosistilla carotiformis]|uniref:tRNA modification GTPase MnmE n=1 Tax=Rosistilla carotiformis TaxID=2528017 RepID=A0A518JWM3_9BACT|nr:tRNA uridine-5-carboxymethylaminomethyl(34) synthesis GTPase MnmE [Rosistilla carotiformis]QDV69925.1 tRNA modification GTPase MnmE [Rosistilla carotiformis]